MSTNTDRQAKRQKTDDDSSAAAAEEDRNSASSPTEEDISSTLCKIGDAEKYTTDEVNKALYNLCKWRITSNNNHDECARISKEFIDLGGIPRILNFIQGNKDNVVFMLRASAVIGIFLDSGSHDQYLEHASTMAQKFIEREGVEMMLSIIKEQYTGEMDINQLQTLGIIFGVFTNTIWNTTTFLLFNKKNMVDIDRFLPIIDAGISTLAILRNIRTHDTAVARVKEEIFNFFRNFVHYNAEMIDVVEFHEKNIFLKCVGALKNPVDNTWKYNNKTWGTASSFFYQCCCGNRKNFSRENDFEVIIPFLIHFIKADPDYASRLYAFDILREASDTIGKKKMTKKTKGLLRVLGATADPDNDDNVSDDVQEKAMHLMKHLFDES